MRCRTFLFAFAVAASCCAQEKTSPPRFTARTELVTVPVVASRGGKFVAGLKREDFTVFEDGKAKTIAFFEEVKAPAVPAHPTQAAAEEFTNTLATPGEPVAVNVILFSSFSMTPGFYQGFARDALMEFLENAAQQRVPTMIAAVGSSGLRPAGLQIVHDFTTSHDVLLAALQRVRNASGMLGSTRSDPLGASGEADRNTVANGIDVAREARTLAETMGSPTDPITGMQRRLDQERTGSIMGAFEQLARGLQGIPGRKAVIWISPGFACDFFGGWRTNLRGERVAAGQACVDLWRELSAANIAVYQVNPLPAENPTYTSPEFQNARSGYSSDVQRELMSQSLTSYTGGTVCSFRNDLAECFRRAIEDSSHYYMLSYYATPEKNPVWRKIVVKIAARGVRVRARSGYITAGTEETWEQRRKNDVALAVMSPLEYTGVPMTVRWTGVMPDGDKKKHGFEIRLPPEAFAVDESDQNHFKLSLVAVTVSDELRTLGDVTQEIEGHLRAESLQKLKKDGFVYRNAITLPHGEHTVKFILRDDLSGRLGTVTAPTPRISAGSR